MIVDSEQLIDLRRFSNEKCLYSDYEYVSPEELYSEYVKFVSQPLERVAFTGEMIRLGWILHRPSKEDPMIESGWRLRLRAPCPDMVEPENSIQDELEALRKETFKQILLARRAGKHALANANTKAYLDILRARREEFPSNPESKEGASFADSD